ncbi:hypothetical protein AAC387_Pa06g1096 [Persea americana]
MTGQSSSSCPLLPLQNPDPMGFCNDLHEPSTYQNRSFVPLFYTTLRCSLAQVIGFYSNDGQHRLLPPSFCVCNRGLIALLPSSTSPASPSSVDLYVLRSP